MASLVTHFTASLLLCPLGVRRLICSVSLFLKNPSLYRSRIWYFSEPKWKNFDLYALLISLPIASLSLIFIFLAFSENPTYRFSFLQQSLVVFLFWAILVFIILKESSDLFPVPENFVFIFAGIAFFVESYMCGRGVTGLGGWVYGILTSLDIFCAACCLYLSIRPSTFFAEFLLSSGIFLKGTWVLQVGLSLYTDAFGFKGCHKISELTLGKGDVDVKCELDDDMWRVVGANSENERDGESQSLLQNEEDGLSRKSEIPRKKEVQWLDKNGDKLAEILEFQPSFVSVCSDVSESDEDDSDSCSCRIM